MAPPPQKTIAGLQKEIQQLNEKFSQGKLSSTDFLTQLGELENKLNLLYSLEIDAPIVREKDIQIEQAKLRKGLKQTPARLQMAESLDEEAVKRAEEQIRRRVMPELYKTGEIGTSAVRPSWGLSTIVDPVKGLVLDTETNQVRKATPEEFAYEALKRQVLYTPEFAIPIGEKQQKIAELKKELDVARANVPRGFTGISGISPEAARGMVEAEARRRRRLLEIPMEIARLEKEFEQAPEYAIIQESGYMPETNLGWGFRMLMSGSAAVAPMVKETQDLISRMTDTPISTRKGAGYQESQIDVPYNMGQFLTNLATGQGVFQQMQAQLMPADTQNDGLLGFGTQGTYQSLALSLAPELGIPITPIGVAGKATRIAGKTLQGTGRLAGSTKLQKVGQFISDPVESILYHGHKAELNKALKSVDEGLSARQLEKEIAKEGGLLSRSTLRAKTAETIGDIQGSIKALEVAIDTAEEAGQTFITLADVGVVNSPFLTNLIGGGKAIDDLVQQIQPIVRSLDEVAKGNVPSLRRSTEIATDTVNAIMKGTKPVSDADIVSRSVRSAFLRNIDWDNIFDVLRVPKTAGVEARVNRTKDLLIKSQTQGLKSTEIKDLGDSLQALDKYGLFEGGQAIKQSPKVVYESIRDGVASVLRDNFLKTIPDDYIDIGGTVAVPLAKIQTSTGRMTPGFKQHQQQKARLLESTVRSVPVSVPQKSSIRALPRNELRYTLTQDAANGILNFARTTGLQIPVQLVDKIESAASGTLQTLNALTSMEYQALENIISGELAIKFLDGVSLKAGTLTGELATLRGAARDTLISPTQERGAFAIKLQGMFNAIKHLRGKEGIFTRTYEKLFAKELLPVPLYRLQREIQVAQQASFKQVTSRLQENIQQASSPSQRLELYHRTIEEYVQIGVSQQLGKAETTATRRTMGLEETTRRDIVGQSEALKKIEQQKLVQFEQKKYDQLSEIQQNKIDQVKKREALYADRIARENEKGQQQIDRLQKELLSKQQTKVEREYQNKREQLINRAQKKIDKTEDIKKIQSIEEQQNKALSALEKRYKPQIEAARKRLKEKKYTPEQQKKIVEREQIIQNRIARIKEDTEMRIDVLFEKKKEELTRISNRFDQQIEQAKARVSERMVQEDARQLEKSKRVARERILSQLGEKYGRKNVNNFLKDQGIGNTYDDLNKIIDDLEFNMQAYTDGVYRGKLWENVIKKFFTKPVTKLISPLNEIDDISATIFRDVIRKDLEQPFYQADNILQFTPDNVRLVIGRMKEKAPYLNKFGLKGGLTGVDYNYPLIEMMNDIQRTQNVNRAVQQFVIEQPDMLVNLNRMSQGVAGLDNYESMAQLLDNEINLLLRMAVNQNKVDELQVDFLLDTIKEVLFDGVMKDVWTLSGRERQRKFLNGYLGQMVYTGSTNVDMSQYLTNLVVDGVLKTNTFQKIENKALKILTRYKDLVEQTLPLNLATDKVMTEVLKDLPQVMSRLQQEYLLQIIGSANGNSTGIFGQQLMYLHNYMTRFGLNQNTLAQNLRNMKPTIDYIGDTNMALLYGNVTGELLPKILNRFKESAFSEKLQQMATQYQGLASAGYNMLYYADMLASQMRRLSTANMLYGIGLPTTRFLGFNRLTAPSIFGATIGHGGTSVKQAIKFVGLSGTMGLASLADRVLTKQMRFKGMFDSTRYLHAPDDEIIIFANKTNAGRNYTAKELRDLTDQYGIQYSRSSIEFYDQEYKELLDLVGVKPDGTMKGIPSKIVDILNPTKTNYLARIAMVQDAELRQFVFIESLKEGATIKQAADLAKRSMLDYTSLSNFERQYIARYVYFYAFMRTMGVETLNSFARGGFAPRLLRVQNNLSQAVAQDVVGYTDDQRGRVYNMFVGDVDERDIYLSGPPNPQMQMFELMSTAVLLGMNVVEDVSETGRTDFAKENVLFDTILQSGLKTAESNPMLDTLFEYIRVSAGGRRIRQFPSELIYAAEQQGMLDEVIQMYDLVEMDYISPARPLTLGRDGEAGKYYTFRKDTAGNKGYFTYLRHRLMGMASFTMGIEHGMGGLIDVQTPYYAAMTRNWRDYYKAQMLTEPRGIEVPVLDYVVPYKDRQSVGQRTIPTTQRYLKGATIQQDIDLTREQLWALYMMGAITPTKAKSRNTVIMRNLQDGLRALETIEKEMKTR